MEIDFKKIRPLEGDRKLGFEEFCCQVAEEDVKRETRSDFAGHNFRRKEGKAGDAGVECYYVLPGGDEWGWQAKYFIRGLGPTQWKQIDKSVMTALGRHPRLVRYIVCLPTNLSDSRDPAKQSQTDHWEKHQKKWGKWARERGRDVEFILWGDYQLQKRMMELGDRGAGFIHYWFDERLLTAEWFLTRFAETEKDAGPRYTPELHVELPISSQFDALGRTDSFFQNIERSHDWLMRKWKKVLGCSEIREVPGLSEAVYSLSRKVEALAAVLDRLSTEAFDQVPIAPLPDLVAESATETGALIARLGPGKEAPGDLAQGLRSPLGDYLFELLPSFDDIAEFANGPEAHLAQQRAVLLYGDAGTGKTHLFCDLAKKRIAEGLPTVVLLGQKFWLGSTPWSQIIHQLHLGEMEAEKFLGALDTAARVRGKRALILIDALNEGPGADLWKNHIGGMLATLCNFPRVVCAVSCRESYVEDVIPEELLNIGDIYRVRHRGFEGHEFDATRSFFAYYGIQSPAEPLLVPEFSNPLFLKLLCKGLQNEKMIQIPKGLKGITRLFDFFICSVNRVICERLDMDKGDNMVRRVVDALAQRMADQGQTWLEKSEAKEIINRIRSEPPEYERSLFRNLIHEGLLREDPYRSEGDLDKVDGVSFAYERLADHLLVSFWLSGMADSKNPKSVLQRIPVVKKLMEDEWFAYRYVGWVEALSIQIPELVGKELVQLFPRKKESRAFRHAFLTSLLWREPGKVGRGAIRFLNEILGYCTEHEFESAMNALLMVACDPEHRLNARGLHRWLSTFSMGERDHLWSIFLHRQYQWNEEGPIDRLIEWAWNADKGQATEEVIELCGIVLTWFLTSSNRFLRDHATKALVAMLRERPRVWLRISEHFQGIDDPYVLERLYAVGYGVAMLTEDDVAVAELSGDVYTQIFAGGAPSPHILLRDYARGVIEVAEHRGVLPAIVKRELTLPPYRSPWPPIIPTAEELAVYGKRPDDRNDPRWSLVRLYNGIMGSGHFASDWVIYVLRPACHRFAWISPESLGVLDLRDDTPDGAAIVRREFDARLAQRWIIKRVLDLGWTTERFGRFDERVTRERPYRRIDNSKPERMGKKYAWIAMHEFLGYLSDHAAYCGDRWKGGPQEYHGPWQFFLRNIDPSLLVRSTSRTEWPEADQCWWQPVNFRFLEQAKQDFKHWVRDCSDLFDPLDLVQVRDAEGQEWLTLEGIYDWTEKPPLGEDPHDIPRRHLWLMIKSYIVKSSHSTRLTRWLNDQSLWGKWMPESAEMFRVFLGEYPRAQAFAGHEANRAWTTGYHPELPHPVVVTATEYLRERGYDCSIDENVAGLLPSRWLVDTMGLKWSRKGFSFADGNGRIVAFDPSEHESGPGALLVVRDSLIAFLRENKFDLIWTILGLRVVFESDFRSGRDAEEYEGRTLLQGLYRLRNGKVTRGPLRSLWEP